MSLLRRQILVTVTLTLAFIAVGFAAAFVITHVQTREMRRERPSFFARLVDEIAERENVPPSEAVDWLRRAAEPSGPFTFAVRDAASFDPEQARAIAAAAPYEHVSALPDAMKLRRGSNSVLIVGHRGPLDGSPPGAPPPPPPDGGRPPDQPFAPRWLGEGRVFAVNFVALVLSILVASTLSTLSLFYSLRGKAGLADHVLTAIKSGNLKARFPITRTDEVGQVMVKFNAMADEIEALVQRLHATELSRTRLLQELAHDLRTPIASLRAVLETLVQRDDRLTAPDRAQLLSLSLTETRYFEHLVEDLLFLAQVTDPQYQGERDRVDVGHLIANEVDGLRLRPANDRPIRITFAPTPMIVAGDARALQRLVRNALENAHSFARTEVHVSINGRRLVVEDDGPGVSPEVARTFGEKRASRVFSPTDAGRVSVGLGAVIMKAVATAHGGDVAIGMVGNRTQLVVLLKLADQPVDGGQTNAG